MSKHPLLWRMLSALTGIATGLRCTSENHWRWASLEMGISTDGTPITCAIGPKILSPPYNRKNSKDVLSNIPRSRFRPRCIVKCVNTTSANVNDLRFYGLRPCSGIGIGNILKLMASPHLFECIQKPLGLSM